MWCATLKITEEDVSNITDEIQEAKIRYVTIEHVPDSNNFFIWAKFWLEDDFTKCRKIGLAVIGVMLAYDSAKKDWFTQIEVEYIGKHRLVMG